MDIRKVNINDLKPVTYNPRKSLKPGDKEYEDLKNSITKFGYVNLIIVDDDNNVIGGHQRIPVLKELGYKDIDVVSVDISENEAKILNIALNKIHGEWDMEKLNDLLQEIKVESWDDFGLTGFDMKRILTLAMAQGGDFIGGAGSQLGTGIVMKRKAMNTLLLSTDRPFQFMGRINEDVNTYVRLGMLGHLFLTVSLVSIEQQGTQSNAGGMSDIYLENGTYIKSFYTILYCPSCVRISKMGVMERRFHHKILWKYAVPKILSEENKKLF